METRKHKSPSGKYTLEIIPKETKPGCWNYTTGVVKLDDRMVLAEVERNYSSFPFLFVEGHKKSSHPMDEHDYLICGADYQGQTVIDLCCMERKDFLPEAAKKGFGFCWVDYTFNVEHQMLIVDGCIWACPYEYRFYDFSDPMEGWPELTIDSPDGYVSAEGKSPTINTDGTIVCYEVRRDEDDDEDEEDEEEPEGRVVATQTFRREGGKLKLVDEWVDEVERTRRDESARRRKEWEEKWANYKATDPLFLRVKECVSSDSFNPPEYSLSIGQCYKGWCPHYDGDDSRVCWRLAFKQEVGNHKVTLDLEWGMESAPVKLVYYKNGKDSTVFWFDHSLDGINAALDQALELLTASSLLDQIKGCLRP
jgi:hypothetical protein